MTHTSPLRLSLRFLTGLLVMSLGAAALAPAVAAPMGASNHLAAALQGTWHVNDNPEYHGRSWKVGQPESAGYGYGIGRYYYNGTYSDYIFVARGVGNPAGHWARWAMGTRSGTQEIEAFIPHVQANARVQYIIKVGSRTARSVWVNQVDEFGWTSLGEVTANGNSVTVEVHYDTAQTARGAYSRIVGVDAMRIRQVSTGIDEIKQELSDLEQQHADYGECVDVAVERTVRGVTLVADALEIESDIIRGLNWVSLILSPIPGGASIVIAAIQAFLGEVSTLIDALRRLGRELPHFFDPASEEWCQPGPSG